jgi:hypothetical protein
MIDYNAEWRPIPDWPEYSVSEEGHVARVKQAQGARAGRHLKPWRNVQNQYLCVHLWRGNRPKGFPVHRLVALAFHGYPPSRDHVVAHCDGSRDNNQPWNLRWATQRENVADTLVHGTHNRGHRNGSAKLSESDVLKILELTATGLSQANLALRFGISRQQVGDIINGRRWSHLGAEQRAALVKARSSTPPKSAETGE